MDRQTLAHYGWIAVFVFTLFIFLTFATPFGKYVGTSISDIGVAIVDANEKTTNQEKVDQMSDKYGDMLSGGQLTFEPGWDEKDQKDNETDTTIPAYALILESGTGDDTKPMIFVRSYTEIKAGDIYNSLTYGPKVVKAAYTGFEDVIYPYSPGAPCPAPWKDNIQTVTSIRAEQTIRPISMAGWFNDSCAVSYLDVSSVTNFNMCFYYLGHPVDYTLDVSMWNVGTVSKKTNIIAYAGGTILLPAKLK